MRRSALNAAVTALLVVIIAALAVFIGPRLIPGTGGDGVGGPPPGPSTEPPTLSPSPAQSPPVAGCFDPNAPSEPVVFTNPEGRPPAEPDEGDRFAPAARRLPTFAGLWVDPFRQRFHIALTCDIEGAIEEIGRLVPRGLEIHFHLVQYTYAELERIRDALFADRDALMGEGIYVGYGAIDEIGNRVEIGIDPLTDAIADELRARYGQPIVFGHSPRPEPVPSRRPGEREMLVAVLAPPDDEPMVTCGGRAFPAAVLDHPDAEDVPADLAEDLRAVAAFWRNEFPRLEELTWRLAYRDDTTALFLASEGDGWLYLGMDRDAEGWTPSGAGECSPRPVIEDTGPATWWLDPAFPAPGEEATELHILVMELNCAGGTPAFARIGPPVVDYTAESLVMTVGVRPRGGAQTCPSNPPTPATVTLPEPLGERELLDGGRHPPAPPTPDW